MCAGTQLSAFPLEKLRIALKFDTLFGLQLSNVHAVNQNGNILADMSTEQFAIELQIPSLFPAPIRFAL
jgi:hypothetical protein